MIIKKNDCINWFAPDGLMMLDLAPIGLHAPYGEAKLETAANDNGILFATHYYYLLHLRDKLSLADRDRFASAVDATQVHTCKGLYDRNPKRADELNSFDNYVGVVAGSVLFNLPYAEHVCDLGDHTGYIFNNTLRQKDEARAWRQGSEIAWYQLCAGRTPQLWNLAWYVLSCLWTAIAYGPERGSDHLNTWLRVSALEIAAARAKTERFLRWSELVALIAGNVWRLSIWIKTRRQGIAAVIDAYYRNADHPCRTLVDHEVTRAQLHDH